MHNQPRTELQPVELPPGLKWIAIGLVLMVVVGLIALTLGPTMLRDWRELQLRDHGTDAVGELLSLKDTGNRYNEDPVVQVTVEVRPEGRAPYRASIEKPMSAVELKNYEVGMQVRVRYDAEHPERFALMGPLGTDKQPVEPIRATP